MPDRQAFVALLARLGDAWNAGSAEGAGACFAETVDHADPTRDRFAPRAALLPFFEPPPAATRWRGTGSSSTPQPGRASSSTRTDWREYQHLDGDQGFETFVAGPSLTNGPSQHAAGSASGA